LEPKDRYSNRAPSCSDSDGAYRNEWLDLNSLTIGAERIGGMLIQSAEMRKALETIKRLGHYKTTVLVCGESGTGKELVARALHTLSGGARGPFVTFNCSNLVESLAESQLFGHVRGAFTDAREDSLGYFRSANHGTLFLDEIGELPLRLQPKLLRAVEMHEVQPVGSGKSYTVDIRLIAATNRDLPAMVQAGQFRDDLYYRLNAAAIIIPPLRQRRDGIGSLTAHFVEHYNRLFGKSIRFISRQALAAVTAYDWPGNVRELSHAIQSAAMLTDNDHLDVTALPERVVDTPSTAQVIAELQSRPATSEPAEVVVSAFAHHAQVGFQAPSRAPDEPLVAEVSEEISVLEEVIKSAVVRSLEQADGNRRRAADKLGISRSTLYRMLARYGLAVATKRSHTSV
jgi:transcriptional regulator with GAF, ATPase, and Fis domain